MWACQTVKKFQFEHRCVLFSWRQSAFYSFEVGINRRRSIRERVKLPGYLKYKTNFIDTTWLGPTKHVALSVAPATRGANLWFHHDMILNRFIRQRYDICRYKKSAAIRFRFDSGICDWYEAISYAHLTQPLTFTSTHINLIIISSFYFFALPDI